MSTSLRTTTAASRLSRLFRSSSSSISTLALSASFLSISPDLSSLLHFFIIHLSLTYASPSLLNLYRRAVTFLLRDLRSKLGFPISAVATSEDCSTFYCNDCVSKYIAAKLQDNILSIECLVSGCKSSVRLEPDKCRQILPREVFDQWDDALSEAVLMRSKRLYCPYKDCSALLFIDKSEVKMKDSECPHFHRMVCVECGTKWHPEITCEEFQKLAGNERGRDNILLATMAKKKNWKRCYSCKLYIEKSQGCLYMKCRYMYILLLLITCDANL
ncbi:probable E3 ubiquitin-protein ligase RNF144A-B [Arabidopsis lyrata subsp. lyrata]|uniref:probable E3 ubiquitin-protein ligase RNF144A-B n=1 Tax=Arabidopsis lyrata subsp. lyrata TaxID=81972 RepID=UPI000A29CE43|nr:probable E3 ubiquitin-protein ligase RNF144A-B [Arabidopsis lyrata subsp. lyrata]|eukprot:XP_020874087.1 probable E3 ubiquitin-protein ligase RNF144A-B [Arabidopsis lyrata subsp. lyrata]